MPKKLKLPRRALLMRCTAAEALQLVCTAAQAGEILGGITQERIGQLCLEKSLVAKRDGRDWLISVRSVLDYASKRSPG